MSTVNGLPAHVLLVHFIVVLAPLTALLAILCHLVFRARAAGLAGACAVGVRRGADSDHHRGRRMVGAQRSASRHRCTSTRTSATR